MLSQTANRLWIVGLLIVMGFGLWARLSPRFAGAIGAGHDERLYSHYLDTLSESNSYPALIRDYIQIEANVTETRVPPRRALYLLHSWAWRKIHSGPAFPTMLEVSQQASIASLILAGLLGFRLGGRSGSLAMSCWMAVAPLQVFNAHRALLDGHFTFWILAMLWACWECLEQPENVRFRYLFGLSWVPLVLSKESALFAWLGILAILIFLPTRSGRRAHPGVWLAAFVGPALGVAILISLCGGFQPFIHLAKMTVSKPLAPFTQQHADGPWWGYLLSAMLLSPLFTLLACAAPLSETRKHRSTRFMTLFLLGTLAPLSCLKYQIVPRLLAFCEFPLRWLAWMQLRSWGAHPTMLAVFVVALAGLDFYQFWFYFQLHGVYEPTCDVLLWCLKVVKTLQ